MRITLSHQDYAEIELPDSWGIAAALATAQGKQCYSTEGQVQYADLTDIEILPRTRGCGPFDPARMRAILDAIANGQPLPPIDVDQPPASPRPVYRLRDGFHRYFASVAVGFTTVPVRVLAYFDWND